jgi:hypothetical protein
VPIQIRRAAVKYMFDENDVVYTYSTKQAIKDGFLILIDPSVTKPLGINYPVVFTSAVYDAGILHDNTTKKSTINHRVAEIINWYKRYVQAEQPKSQTVLFWAPVLKTSVQLKAFVNAFDFDDPSPAIFIMYPNED